MKTKSGQLVLTKSEQEALQTIVSHTLSDIDNIGGSYQIIDGEEDEYGMPIDEKAIKQAKLGIEVIKFVLQVAN